MPGMNPKTGRWSRDGEEIVIAVQRAFSTPRGTRVMRRFLGAERAQLQDRPIEPGMLGPSAKALAESLRYEPRVRFRRLSIDRAATDGSIALAIDIDVVATGQGMRVTT